MEPIQPTWTNSGLFNSPGSVQVEGTYKASLFEAPVENLQSFDFLGAVTVGELIEARLRWNLINVAGDESGLGDFGIGIKGGFYGGWDEAYSLAGIGEVRFATGADGFSLGEGIEVLAGAAGTYAGKKLRFDAQLAVQAHIFTSHPHLALPVGFATTWEPIERFRVMGEFVLGFDLTNFSDSTTSLLGGVGYIPIDPLSIDVSVRVGLSQRLPDATITAGLSWLIGDFF